jgi:hypothetical protein
MVDALDIAIAEGAVSAVVVEAGDFVYLTEVDICHYC